MHPITRHEPRFHAWRIVAVADHCGWHKGDVISQHDSYSAAIAALLWSRQGGCRAIRGVL